MNTTKTAFDITYETHYAQASKLRAEAVKGFYADLRSWFTSKIDDSKQASSVKTANGSEPVASCA